MADHQREANKLHHLGMIYVGAVAEVAQGKVVGVLPADNPGVHNIRDLIDLVLFARAEINGLTNLLVRRNIVNEEQLNREFAEQYRYLAQTKAKQFGVGVNDLGLVFGKVQGDETPTTPKAGPKQYQDLANIPEDQRIEFIGEAAMAGNATAFCVDDEPGKPERYIEKLLAKYPKIRITDQFKGPVAGVVTVKLIVEEKRN